MTTARAAAALAALLLAAACAAPPPLSAPAAAALPWPEPPQGCDADGAPPRPAAYDEAAVARAMTWVYRDHPVESYCGCRFARDLALLPGTCGFQDDGVAPAAVRWEPIVPPSRFGVYRDCWKRWSVDEGDNALARRKCAEADPEFRAMEADLYNFHPALAALSQRRGDNPFGTVQGEPREYGRCDFETQSVMGKYAVVEPPPEMMGDIARAYLYMATRYGRGKDWKIKLSREQRQLFEAWDQADPPDDFERLRACRIQAIQGWDNPYVK